jgi:O-antigen/teichoic acid export membrane protein
MSGFLRNVTSNWAAIVINIGLSFVLAPIVVHSLGSVYYGIWTLMMQFTGYLWLFDFGVRESVVKYVAQYNAAEDHEELQATVETALSLYSVVAALAMCAVVLVSLALPYLFNIPAEAVTVARLTALVTGTTIAFGFVFNVFVGIMMALQENYRLARVGIGLGLVRAVLTYVLLAAGYGVVMLAVLQLVMSLASSVFLYRICTERLPFLSVRLIRPTRARVVKLLNYGKYVLLANVGDKMVFATDAIVIGIFLPIASLTYYAIGGSLIEHFRSFITSMGALLNPLSSSLEAKKQTNSVAALMMSGTRAAMLVGLPVCIGFIVLGERFIELWMGNTYSHVAGQVLAVLATGYLLGLPYYSISGVLYGLNQHWIVAWSRVAEGIGKLILSVVLVQRFGLIGVAMGTAVVHAIMVVGFLPLVLPRLLPIRLSEYYWQTYLRPLMASLPFAVATMVIARVVQPSNMPSFLLLGVVSLVFYVGPCWFFALSAVERALVGAAFGRRRRPAVS